MRLNYFLKNDDTRLHLFDCLLEAAELGNGLILRSFFFFVIVIIHSLSGLFVLLFVFVIFVEGQHDV